MTFGSAPRRTAPEFHLSYLIGEPGTGKSTLAAHLTRALQHADRDKPFAHRLYLQSGVHELGKRRPDFPGTDALSMSVQPTVLEWMERARPFWVFAEGDRLGNGSFFAAASELGYQVRIWALVGEEAAALHRRLRGSEQDDQWIAGRRKKVYNILESGAHPVYRLDAGGRPDHLEAQMLNADDPVVSQLRGQR